MRFAIRGLLLLVSAIPSFAQPKSELGPPPPLDPVRAVSEARVLVADLLGRRPEEGSTNTGVLKIRPRGGPQHEIPLRIEIVSTPTNWFTVYQTVSGSNGAAAAKLTVIPSANQPNRYLLSEADTAAPKELQGSQISVPFAGSDFWVVDLGLDFLHWPQQRLLRKELRRSLSCAVLESANPQPAPGGYSRVVSWIDLDNGGIVHADAYDAGNELLKQFDPTTLKSVRGQRQLEEMEMRNRQTGSHTWIKFSLPSE
jgi:hypothetical protein